MKLTSNNLWIFQDDDINTDVIFPGRYTYDPLTPEQMAQLQQLPPEQRAQVEQKLAAQGGMGPAFLCEFIEGEGPAGEDSEDIKFVGDV